MSKLAIVLPAFILMVLLQLYLPISKIQNREQILSVGSLYRFKIIPIDPRDPFRGHYLDLQYEAVEVSIDDETDWSPDQEVFVSISKDTAGYAQVEAVSVVAPENHQDYVRANVQSVTKDGTNRLIIDYPFDRFYMEESKAAEVEETYARVLRDSSQMVYALISIRSGEAVIRDILVDGASLEILIE